MYIVVKMVWFIMFRYLLVIADKKISDIMCIFTIVIDTIDNFFLNFKKIKSSQKEKQKKQINGK